MGYLLKIALALFFSAAGIATADAGPREDAELIVARFASDRDFEVVFSATRPMLEQALRAPFEELDDRVISDKARALFIEMFFEEFKTSYAQRFRDELAKAYEKELSPETLAAFAAFLQTEAGQEFSEKGPLLRMTGSEIGARVGSQAGREAGAKVYDRLIADGDEFFKPSERDLMIKFLLGGE